MVHRDIWPWESARPTMRERDLGRAEWVSREGIRRINAHIHAHDVLVSLFEYSLLVYQLLEP